MSSSVSRFLLFIFLAKYLEPSTLGVFGLFISTISLMMLVVGGDFYTYSQRKIMTLPSSMWHIVIHNQIIALLILYFVFFPPQFLLFIFNLLPSNLLYWFIFILLVEHLGQEINRLLIAIKKPIYASLVLFVRTSAWIYFILFFMYFFPMSRNLENIFFSWFIAASIAILMGMFVIYRSVPIWKFVSIDWSWIKKGYKVSLYLLFSTICFKVLVTADRYIVEILNNSDILGVYVLFSGISMSILSILDSAIHSFKYPEAVTAYSDYNLKKFKNIIKEMLIATLFLCVLWVSITYLLTPMIFEWIGKDIFIQNKSLLWILMAAFILYGLSLIPHYGLYAKQADKYILYTQLSSLAVFFIIILLYADKDPINVTAYSLLIAFLWLTITKFYFYFSFDSKINKFL